MTTFGLVEPLVWNKRTKNLCGGHQRLSILEETGASHVEVSVVDLDEREEKALNLALNKHAGEWDFASLADMLQELDAGDLDMDITGFDQAELEKLMTWTPPNAGLTDEDAVPEPPKTPVTKPGDLWLLGRHRLMCGDSTDAQDVTALLDGERAMLMSTDPPYGVDFKGAKYNPRAKHWDGIRNDKIHGDDLRAFLVATLNAWTPHIDEASAFYFWTAAMEEGAAAAAAIRDMGLHIQAQIIWRKNCLVLGQADYHWMHENCWYAFWKGKKHRWYGERKQTTVWEVNKIANAAYVHPNQKPVELYAIPIRNHTSSGDIIVDPFAGSGTGIIAAEMLGRICCAMELDPVYVDVAVQRWEEFTGLKATRA